jgi:hypothetical protein
MREPTGATQVFGVIGRHCPVADLVIDAVRTRAVAAGIVMPQSIITRHHRGHLALLGQVRQSGSTAQAGDVLKVNEILAIGAVEGFHRIRCI